MKRLNFIEKSVIFGGASLWLIACIFPLYNLICVTFSSDSSSLTRTLVPNSFSNGIQKIKFAFYNAGIVKGTLDSILITVVTIAGMLFICSLAAYEFAFYQFPLKKVLFGAIMSSMMLPMVLYVVPLYRFVVNAGLGDTVPGVSLPLMVSALSVFILLQFLEDIPLSLIESARIDGAGHFRVFFSIVFPMMRNAVITVTVLMFLSVWSAYLWPSLVASTNIRPMSVATASLLSPNFYVDPRVKIAAMLISSIVPLGIYFGFQKYIIDGIAASGVKG
jgi:multiple sugar transport system permease protein